MSVRLRDGDAVHTVPTVQRQPGDHQPAPLYLQVAGDLREAIKSGDLRPGQLLPPEPNLVEHYGVSLNVVRMALGTLRGEGLIETRQGKGSFVRESPEVAVVQIPPGARISSRMPTPPERRRLGLVEGVPILVVTVNGGAEIYPADRVEIETINDRMSSDESSQDS